MIGRTERIGAYGISVIGFFRAKWGDCQHCPTRDVLHRVWNGSAGGYRFYLIGEYCLGCARALASKRWEQDQAEHRAAVQREWNT